MYKLGEYISYDDVFLNNVMSLLSHYRILGLNNNCILLEENKEFLNEMISLYVSLEPDKNTQVISPKIIGINEMMELANNTLISILPSFKENIIQYDDLLYFYDGFPFSNSCYNYKITEKGVVLPKSIDVSTDINEYSISIINHEKVHTLMMEKIDLKNYLSIYMELFSFIIQKITNYQLIEKKFSLNSFIIDNIIHTVDNQKNIDVIDSLKDIEIEKETLENYFIYNYLNLKANEYLIADWYSELLFKYYLVDSSKMKEKINQVFKQEMTVQELLNYYKISLSNRELVPCIVEKLDSVKKCTIKL